MNSEVAQAQPNNAIAGWIRAGVSVTAFLCVAVLSISWLCIGIRGQPLAFGVQGLALAVLVTVLSFALAVAATKISWGATAVRSTELLVGFMIALAFGFAWRLFQYGEVQERFLGYWLIPWIKSHYPANEVLGKFRRADWFEAPLNECAHIALMLAPTLFLLFTEQFPRPLATSQLGQSLARQLVWPLLSSLKLPSAVAAPGRRVGIVESSLIFLCACLAMASAIASPVPLAWQRADRLLMFVLTGVIVAAATVYLVRWFERTPEPWAVERWLTSDVGTGPPRLPWSSMLLCLWLALAIDVLNYHSPLRNPSGSSTAIDSIFNGALLVPALLLRVRAVRAEFRTAFWVGWAVVVFASSPNLPRLLDAASGYSRSTAAVLWWTFVCTLAGCGNLILSYRASNAEDRNRIYWMVLGVVLSCVAMLATMLWFLGCAFMWTCNKDSPLYYGVVFIPTTVLVLCMLVAVFYSGAIDPRLALRKSLTYLLLGFFVSVIFTGLEISLEHLLTEISGPDISKWVAASITFTVINPTKHACERVVETGVDFVLRLVSAWL